MSETIAITTPLTEEAVAGLRAGDRVLITGTLLAARDAA
ncbi:MAG TPA: TRZ/ATZ family protein, partial [Thermoleophilia bacterium]|nr:TRZ/ATZ family protein [Thermoleophilia bacterium]